MGGLGKTRGGGSGYHSHVWATEKARDVGLQKADGGDWLDRERATGAAMVMVLIVWSGKKEEKPGGHTRAGAGMGWLGGRFLYIARRRDY